MVAVRSRCSVIPRSLQTKVLYREEEDIQAPAWHPSAPAACQLPKETRTRGVGQAMLWSALSRWLLRQPGAHIRLMLLMKVRKEGRHSHRLVLPPPKARR